MLYETLTQHRKMHECALDTTKSIGALLMLLIDKGLISKAELAEYYDKFKNLE